MYQAHAFILLWNYLTSQVALVVSVFGQILEACLSDSEIVDKHTAQRMGRVLKGMQTSMPSTVMEKAWGGLTPGQKTAIQQATCC